jgi:hypothetical protein
MQREKQRADERMNERYLCFFLLTENMKKKIHRHTMTTADIACLSLLFSLCNVVCIWEYVVRDEQKRKTLLRMIYKWRRRKGELVVSSGAEPFHVQLLLSLTHTHTSVYTYIYTYTRIDGRYRSIGMKKKNVRTRVCIKKIYKYFSFLLFFYVGSTFDKKVKWLTV